MGVINFFKTVQFCTDAQLVSQRELSMRIKQTLSLRIHARPPAGLVRWKTMVTSHRRPFSSAGDQHDQNVLLKSEGRP